MKTISLKLDEAVFEDTENLLAVLEKPRNRYINEALDYYNKLQKRYLTAEQLKEESLMVKEDSMATLREFEGFEDGY